ncbi:hypothetical protein BA895_05500 [Humibacillus sp. DSM 29435]|nr:hypothetical protein BA895_05500 [Humibacillus sp. DSM 29435]
MGILEREIRDRAIDSLAEMPRLDVRPIFSGFGFYDDGLLVAAAWDGAFQLRYLEDGHWKYRPVDPATLDDPVALVGLVRERGAQLARDPAARRRR